QFHYYDWIYQWYPYQTVTLQSVGVTDKPVVIGEFPSQGLSAVGGHPARTAAEYQTDLWNQGYAGAISWAFNDAAFPWNPANLSTFAGQHPCETKF
ncbi:MAG TPA: endo-1,4-beta-glucanase, partial [Polyangiaceae bacterium]